MSEMAVLGGVLYVRTGGQFTRIKTGDQGKGPFGCRPLTIEDRENALALQGSG